MSYFSLGDENDNEFAPSLGGMSSNLGSLFGMNAQMDNRAGSNKSLTYTAPKPPRPDKPQQDSQEKKTVGSGVAAAVAITAYKYVENQYQSQGKLAMALISNYTEKDFTILMYVSKQQPVATVKISADFQFNIQSNNYASFHDDQRQAWSILFPNFDQLLNFAKQVCVAKYHSQTEHGVMTQDISLGESDTSPLALGDSVEAKYTGWLVSPVNGTIGTVFDSNHNSDKFFRFKTGKGKVIKGWEDGMLGMKKGGKRFLIIPPAFAYGAKAVGNRVPPNSTLAFEVDIVRLKSSLPNRPTSTSNSNSQQFEQTDSVEISSDSLPSGQSLSALDVQAETIKARAASINEQMSGGSPTSNTGSGKASLVSRMAKVGQPMLPVKPTMQSHEPQVQAVVQSEVPPRPSPIVGASPETYHPNHPDARSTYSNSPVHSNTAMMPNIEYQRVGYSPQPVQTVPLHMMQSALPANVGIQTAGVMGISDISRQAYHPSYPQHFANPGADMLPAILAESQSSNYKLKSLMEKVEEVSEKVSKLKSGSNEYRPASEMMDAAQISFNIQRILQENERVKKQIVERDKLVQQQSDKIADLLQQNHKLIEESHEQITKRSVTFNERMGLNQEKTAKLEQEKLEMSNKLSEATSKVYDLQLQLANATERANSLEKIAKSSAGQIENEVRIRQLESELSSSKESLAAAQSENKKLFTKLQENEADALEERGKKNEAKHSLEIEIGKLQHELNTMKSRHEQELSLIQEKYQTQQNDAVQRQQEFANSWKEKCKNAVTMVSKAAEEKIEETKGETEELNKKLEIFQKKMLQMRQMYQDKVNGEEQLRNELAELVVFKQKYDNLRKQAISMKQQYEEKIAALRNSNDGQSDAPVTQIKSVMNQVFQDVRAKIDHEQEYSGSEILAIILSVIKSVTLSLLTSNESDENEEESEGDDDDAKSDSDNDDSVASETADISKPEIAKKPVTTTRSSPPKDPALETVTKTEAESTENFETSNRNEEECVKETQTGALDIQNKSEYVENLETTDHDKQESIDESGDSSQPIHNRSQEKVKEGNIETVADEQEPIKDDSVCNQGQTTSPGVKIIKESAKSENIDVEEDASIEDSKPTPPPLFDDDDDDDDDSGWLSRWPFTTLPPTQPKNGRLYLGAVGAYDWSGTVTKYDTLDDNIADIPTYEEVKKVLPNRTKESYMGYSVTTGNFEGGTTEYVATGAPRYQLMGAVVVYKPKNDNNEFNDHIRLMGRRSKRKLGSYFGGTVLAVDINGDKKDDLFVGAPLYVHETFDEGRVFVYESISGRASSLAEWKKDEPKELVGDNLPGGRFGTAMASAGDLNDDNYNDVIIGAPLVDGDRGAVFVYHGGPQGIDPAFKQKILASELSGVTLKYFGQSLQGGVDLDRNGYPDIAVGAPKSDTVVIFRARPVVKITPEIKFAGKSAIDIISCIVDHDYVNCSDITVCLTPSGTLIEPEIGLKFNVTMDTKKADADKRLEFGGDVKKFGTAKFTWSETFTVPRYRKKCFTRQVHMKRNVNDYDSVVYAEVEYELTPKHTEAAMSSLRDPSKSNKKEAELRFEQNCADSCKPDLGVTLTLDIPPYAAKDIPSKDLSQNKTIFVVDRTTTSSQLSGRVNLSNFGENAFGAKVWIRHPAEIRWSTVKVLNSYPPSNSCVVPETPSEGDDGIVTQPLKFSSKTTIMQSNSFCYFEFSLITDPLKKNGRLESFTVEAESFLTSDAPPESKDKNTKNNLQKVKTGLLYTSDMNAKEVGSGVDISFNHTRNGTRNITSIREIGNGTDDIVAQFTVLGNGYSKIPVVTAMYTYPWKNDDDEILLYLYDVRCESQNSESGTSCICERANVNSYNLSAEPPVENSTAANYFTVTRRDTLTENLQYNCINGSTSGICQTLKCTISNLGDRDEVTFKAFFRLWTDNLMLNSTEEKARLELRSQFEVNSKPSLRIIDSNGVLPLVKTLESLITARLYTTPSAPEPVADNLWIYILAAVGGLLLLIILVLLLWKLGFFKSKYADMKKDAQEDLQEETEFPDQNGS